MGKIEKYQQRMMERVESRSKMTPAQMDYAFAGVLIDEVEQFSDKKSAKEAKAKQRRQKLKETAEKAQISRELSADPNFGVF